MNIDPAELEILRCPVTGQRLKLSTPESEFLVTTDGKYRYPVVDGVFVMLPPNDAAMNELRLKVKEFYDRFGWEKSSSGQYRDTEIFVAANDVPRQYSSTCMADVARNLPSGGKYLLDAGSGPIPHVKRYMTHGRMWRGVAAMLVMWQRLMPSFTGTYGAYPLLLSRSSWQCH